MDQISGHRATTGMLSSTYGRPISLLECFSALDVDRNGYLTAIELQRALAQGGLNFSLATIANIIRLHDTDGNGVITFPEFEKLHAFLGNVEASFQFFDKSRNGCLSANDVQMALSHSGYDLTTPALQSILIRFDPKRAGALTLTEFLALSVFLRSATATFHAFDPERTGYVHLNFNQYLYACSNTV